MKFYGQSRANKPFSIPNWRNRTQKAPDWGSEQTMGQGHAPRQTWIPESPYTRAYKSPSLFFSSSYLLGSSTWEETDQKNPLGLARLDSTFVHRDRPSQGWVCALSFLPPLPNNKRRLTFRGLCASAPSWDPKSSSGYCSKYPTTLRHWVSSLWHRTQRSFIPPYPCEWSKLTPSLHTTAPRTKLKILQQHLTQFREKLDI